MNKADLHSAVSAQTGLSPKDSRAAVEAAFDVIREAVAKGEKVAITGFGIFEKVTRAPRTSRNPHTGGTVQTPARDVPKFRAGTAFRSHVAGS